MFMYSTLPGYKNDADVESEIDVSILEVSLIPIFSLKLMAV